MDVHSGFLTVKSPGLLKKSNKVNCWCILYSGKGSNIPPRLDVCEDQTKTDPDLCKKSIDITDAKWQKADTFEPSFSFSTRSKRYVFVTKTQDECNTWVQYLCCLCADLFASRKAMAGEGGIGGDVIMQDNCLYASSNNVSLFDVVADRHGSCFRFGFRGLMKLCFEPQSMKLYELNGNHPLAEWSYYSIRSFGHSKHSLNITAGKKSSTGEGNFSFLTVEGEAMSELIAFSTKRLKEQERTGLMSPPPLYGNTSVAAIGPRYTNPGSVLSNSPTSSKTKPAPGIPSPKPVTPTSGHSPTTPTSANAFDAQFKKELNLTIRTGSSHGDGKQSLERKISTDSNIVSSESIGKKEGKKSLKEKEKIAKKEAKEREKLEKERQKQLEKSKKTETKGKEKPPIPRKSYIQDAEVNEYSEAYDGATQNGIEGVYAECNFETRNEPSIKRDAEMLYNEPWGAFPIPIPQAKPENGSGDNDYDDTENVYSSPIKFGDKPQPPRIEEAEEGYEDVGLPPPIIPPNFTSEENDDDSNNNVYDHFAGPALESEESPENVYGLESGKLLNNKVTKKPPKPAPKPDIYETVD